MYSCNCEIEDEDLNHFQNSIAVLAVPLQAVCTVHVDKKYKAVHLSVLNYTDGGKYEMGKLHFYGCFPCEYHGI
jgi:hypothetical protein